MTIRNRLLIVMVGFLCVVAVGFTALVYLVQRHAYESGVDSELRTAALMARDILPPGYHDRIMGKDSVKDPEYQQIVDRFNRRCVEANLEYLWSLMVLDGKIVFTSATSPSKDVAKRDHAGFLDVHSNPELYTRAFETMQPQFQVNTDKWGRIRAVLVPFHDVQGRPYLMGASRKMETLDAYLRTTFLYVIVAGGVVLFLGVLSCLGLANALANPIQAVTKAAAGIAAGDFTQRVQVRGTKELELLVASINTMTQAIQERVRELAESRENLAITLQSIGDAVIATDAKGAITWMNPVAETLTGWTQAKALNKPLEEVFRIVNATTRLPVDNPVGTVLREAQIIGLANHTVLLARDGREIQIADSAAPIHDHANAIVGVVLVFRNVTEEYAKDQALRQSEERFRQAMEATSDGLWDWDITTDNGYFSPAYYRMLGYEGNKFPMTGQTWADFIHPDDRERTLSINQDCIENRRPSFEIEYRMQTKDGSWKWILGRGKAISRDDHGRALRMIGTHVDITGRKRAEKELGESETRFRNLLQNVQSVAVQSYGPDGTVQYWNRASELLYGYTVQEAMGRNLLDLIIPPEMRQEVAKAVQSMVTTGQPIPASELSLMRKDGSKVAVFSSHAVVQKPGCDPELFCIDIDFTERKRAEAEREKLQAQLTHAQKMESIGRLAGGVAHDFNNMLTAIQGNVALTLLELPPASPLRENLNEIQQCAQRSADLTQQLLAYARKQTVAPRVLDFNATVEGMLKMLRRLIGEDIELAWLPGSSLWPVKLDPSQIDQVLANLCVNARDAIDGVGKITIETRNTTFNNAFCASHPGFVEGDYVLLAVSDNGRGIEKALLEHIFEPFFTTKGVGQGTGLGLATVYGIVKQNNGLINVYSEPGQGTAFKIYLPQYVGNTGQVHREDPSHQVTRGCETILLVEDEPAMLRIGKRTLESLGYTVLAAGTPGEAIRMAEEFPGKIHMLMTDVVMPEMNGRDLAKRLLSHHPDLKRLFMSGYTADVIAHRGVLDEGIHFIQKPFSSQDLAHKVRQVLEAVS